VNESIDSLPSRELSGIVLLDKAIGISSNRAIQQVRRLFNVKKVGHTGCLDPMATGVLPVCIGEATKVASYLLVSDKSYLARVKLGVVTETGDSEGRVLQTCPVSITEYNIQVALNELLLRKTQIPPMYSALKQNGQCLYKLARSGITVERKAREMFIHKLELKGFYKDELEIEVDCSKGTYIRTLAEDLGELLGCGAYLSALRRLKSGAFIESQSCSFSKMLKIINERGAAALNSLLIAYDQAVDHIPAMEISVSDGVSIMQGKVVRVYDLKNTGTVRIYIKYNDNESLFIGIGVVDDDGQLLPKRMIAQK